MSDAFPARGVDWPTLAGELEALKADDADWRRGRMASYPYFCREELLDVVAEPAARKVLFQRVGHRSTEPGKTRAISRRRTVGS